jgi:xanthine dehydrogenase molybdopterin-binding subunit B
MPACYVITNPTWFNLLEPACHLQAIGEPPFHLGASVFFALKEAVYAARK